VLYLVAIGAANSARDPDGVEAVLSIPVDFALQELSVGLRSANARVLRALADDLME
jgi:hypothetical protein